MANMAERKTIWTLKIGKYDIKPILIHLPDDEKFVAKFEATKLHLIEQGFNDVFYLTGIHAERWGLKGVRPYLLDNRPEQKFYIGDSKVGGYLSVYASYLVMDALDYSHFLLMEDDVRYVNGWRQELNDQMANLPDDFDILYVGSCCAVDKKAIHVGGSVWYYPYRGMELWGMYPQCLHSIIIAKKAVRHLIDTNRDVSNPPDISIIKYSYPKLKVYALLPRLAEQEGNHIEK